MGTQVLHRPSVLERPGVADDFGTWLLEELARRKLSPADLARGIDVGTSTVSRWTNPIHGVRPNRATAVKIAHYLDLPVADVLKVSGHAAIAQYRPRVDEDDQRLQEVDEQIARLSDELQNALRLRKQITRGN